jgi:ubiquinone/menaquinone biosynthesis C-methylase UbiE
VPSAYDDDLWRLVPQDTGPPPAPLAEFVAALGHVDSALDLGCGDGRLSAALDAADLTLADVSEVALERAAARLPGARTAALDPDAPLPLPDNAFDLVLCAETIEHVRDVQLLLSEARRVLRPGGRLAVTTPAHSRLTGLDVLARGFERRFPPLSPHLRFLSRRSLARLLRELGFEPGPVRRKAGTLLTVAAR